MYGTSTNNRYSRMALRFLGGLCFAVAHLPALAGNAVKVNVNPSTGYFEAAPRMYRVPVNVTMSAANDVWGGAVTKLPGGGLAQPIITNLELTAANDSKPVGSSLRMGGNAVRGAATRCFTSLRCNVALAAGAAGLQALLDGVGWVMTDGALLRPGSPPTKQTTYPPQVPVSTWLYSTNVNFPTCLGSFDHQGASYKTLFCVGSPGSYTNVGCRPVHSGYNLVGSSSGYPSVQCFYGEGDPLSTTSHEPATEPEIIDLFAGYIPEPSDLPWLSPGVDLSDPDVDLDITDVPSFQVPLGTKTIYDAAGNPVEVQDTNVWHDFAPVDNPGKQPGLRDVETEKVDRYGPGGEPLGGTTTVVTRPPASPGAPPTESPVDCDLMPTLCKWLDWTQDGWEDPEEPDFDGLRQVIDLREYDESVVIGPGLMACPEPLALYVPYLDVEVGISYQPFCDLADLLNPLLIALAYFGGAVLLVRSI